MAGKKMDTGEVSRGRGVLLASAAAFFILSGCLAHPLAAAAAAGHSLKIFVSIPPQAYMVERVAGGRASISVLAEGGRDPHTFEPSPRQAMALGGSDIFLTLGMPFEEEIVKRLRDGPMVEDITRGIDKRLMTPRHAGGAGPAGEPDPHVWLSPPLVKIMAGNIAAVLAENDPEGAVEYRHNLAGFEKDLDRVHERVARILDPYRGSNFYVFHPSYGYFGDTYGLVQKAVETGGKAPTPRGISSLIQAAGKDKVGVIFVQPQFDQRSAAALAKGIGGSVVALDPMARDVLANFEEMAVKLEEGLRR